MNDLYSRWLADAALTEVPVRPHTMNLEEKYETSPDRVGHLESNKRALALRSQLIPYLYSLAHRAHEKGEPVFPPLFFYYPDDRTARAIGDETLIGRDLLAAMAIEPGQRSRRVYLPEGVWYDFRDGTRIDSKGQWVDAPLEANGALRLPLYARAGALIPIARGGQLAARIFAGAKGAFELVEDDGETIEYLDGAVRRTAIRHSGGSIEIGAAHGVHRGARSARPVWLEVVGVPAKSVWVDDKRLVRQGSVVALEKAGEGWAQDGATVVIALSANPVTKRRHIHLVD